MTAFPVEEVVPLWMGDIASNSPPIATPSPLWVEDLPVADWYPDPLHAGRLRYWNGFGWTERTICTTPRHNYDAPGGTESLADPGGDGDLPGARRDRRDPVRALLFSAFGRAGSEQQASEL